MENGGETSTTQRREPGPTIIQYWNEQEPPDYIQELLRTFGALNPEMRHLVFSEATAEQFIAEHFGDREVAAFRSCAVPAMQADYFRLCGVLAIGGFYADADFRCVSPLRPLQPAAGQGNLFRAVRGEIMNGFFAFESPGHPFLELSLEIATTNIENRLVSATYFVAGPAIFAFLTRLGQHTSLEALVAALDPSLRPVACSYCRSIDSHARGIRALTGIGISTRIGPPSCVQIADFLPYKRTDLHWKNFTGDIFR